MLIIQQIFEEYLSDALANPTKVVIMQDEKKQNKLYSQIKYFSLTG